MEIEEKDNWQPLESNPEVINNFIASLGFDTSKYVLHDLMTIEEWGQEMLPAPVVAVMFLYPVSKVQEEFSEQQDEEIVKNGQILSPDLFYMKQYASNACGTIAVFHAIINLANEFPDLLAKGSFFEKFIADTKDMDPKERGLYFKKNKELEKVHKEAVDKGDTEVQDEVDTHFIAFIEKDGFLYEMDGTKRSPINHGPCTKEDLLSKACVEIKKFMDRDPEEIKFTLMAMAPPS